MLNIYINGDLIVESLDLGKQAGPGGILTIDFVVKGVDFGNNLTVSSPSISPNLTLLPKNFLILRHFS